MKNNFFRKDLNLSNYWWHRLFLVIFIVTFLGALYEMYEDLFESNHLYIPQWKVINSVEERLTLEVKQIYQLKRSNERVEERDYPQALNSKDTDLRFDDIYCSSDLENRITEVQNKSGVSTLYIRDIYGRNDVSIEVFTNYIKKNNIKCLIPDAYTYSESSRVRFLEPMFYNDLVFYKKSNFLTTLYVLKEFLLIIAIFLIIIVLYYKVLLYIIFGSKKIKNSKGSKKL